MTVFRVIEDHVAVVVGMKYDRDIFRLHIKQKGESLSGIAKKYYGGFGLWPMIWLDNPEIANPNVVPNGFPLLVRRPDRIEMMHRIESMRLFNSWKDFPSLKDVEAKRMRKQVTDHRAIHRPSGEPEWMRWNNGRP